MSSPKELALYEQILEALKVQVTTELLDLARQEILRSDVRDQRSVNCAGLRAKQHFVDFFALELRGRPEVTPKAIEDAAVFMALSVLERFQQACLIQAGGFGCDAPLDAPIVRH